MHMGYISRKGGRSTTAHSAYIGCTKLEETRTGLVFDYSNKKGLLHQGILAPEGCPEWVYDRERLWTAVESFEDHIAHTRFRGHQDPEKNEKSLKAKETYLETCKTAFMAVFALPLEIKNTQHQIDLSERIVKACYVQKGLIADFAIHGDEGNPHLHILATTRPWENESFSKRRFVLEREQLVEMRHIAAEVANEFAVEKGYNYVLDARSYVDRGLKILPTQHLGPEAYHKYKEQSLIDQENQDIHRQNLLKLFSNPTDLVKLVASKKVVFTQADIEREIFKRVGGDMTLYSLLKTKLEGAEVTPEMLKVANDNVGFKREELKSDVGQTTTSFLNLLLRGEDIVAVGTSLKDETVFTTKQLLELEESVQKSVEYLCKVKGKEISSPLKENAIARTESNNKFPFSEEQKQAIDYLLESDSLRILTGKAGTGKTTILKPVVDAYREAGYIPLGTAFQGKVSELLSHELKIPAYNMDQFRHYWERYDQLKEEIQSLKGKALTVAERELNRLAPYQLTDRHVIFLDEGNMVGANLWQCLLKRIQDSGAHLRVVQDSNQIKALYGADIARLVEEKAGSFALTEVHRQKEPWMRKASTHLNNHNLIEGMKPYEEQGCFTFKDSLSLANYALVEAYVNNYLARPQDEHIALAFQNQEVEILNAAIHHHLKEGGNLGKSYTFKGKELSIGDRVIFTQNDNMGRFIKTLESSDSLSHQEKGVKNGTFGQIRGFDEKQSILDVRLLKDNRLVSVNLKTYEHLEYGYAMTINKAEGQTFDRAYGLFSPLMNANKALIWMTRHRYSFQGFVSHEHATNIDEIAAVVGRSEYRPLVSDFGLNSSPEAEMVKRYMAAAYEAGNLWGIISRENLEYPFDHSEWSDFQAAQNERNQCAGEILENLDRCRTFIHQVGLKKITLEIQAGLRERGLSEIELEALQRVEAYRATLYKARTLWDTISETEKASKTSILIKNHEELSEKRNQLAYEIVSFPELHRPFFKTIKKEGAHVSYAGEIYKKAPPTLKAAEKHAQAYMKAQHQKAFSNKLTTDERGIYNELLAFKKKVLDYGRFAAVLKNENILAKQGTSSLKSVLEESSKERDFLAFKIVKFYDKYSPLMERADVSQDQLLKYAVFGEVRQLALKYSLAKTIEKRLEFADKLHGMIGEGDKLDKPRFGILKGMGVNFSRLRFEQGCLELIKQGKDLPFKTIEEVSSAFMSLNEYRAVHQEAAKEWHIIKTHAVQKVTALQDDQIVSLNTWIKYSSHEGKGGKEINAERNILSREALEKIGQQENTKKYKCKKDPQTLQNKDNVTPKEAANTQTLSLVTRELAKIINGYTSLSSENLPPTSLPQDIQTRHVELIHLQSHLRKGQSGYLGIFKMDHAKDKTWESLREKKLSLAGPILEKYGEIIKVSFGHDYGRMQKEAYEHQMGQLASHYQEAKGRNKAMFAANLLSHLEKEGYQGSCTKTQLKTRNVNFETLHLYGLFHEASSHIQEREAALNTLEKYIQAQETFSALWKPRCEVIEKALGPIKQEFAIHREKTLSFLEDKKPNRPCVFAFDKLVNETHALVSKGNLEKKRDNHGQVNSEHSTHTAGQNLQAKVQEKLQRLGVSLGMSFSQEQLESLSHEVISLSHRKEQIHEQRLALMKCTKFENDTEFFECARNRNEAASHLMGSPLGKIIEESKHIFLVKDYAERYRSKLEKARLFSGSSHQIDQKFIFQNTRPFIEAEVVKAVLIENMASFADDIFSSLGEKHNPAASTAVERRYGNNGKFSVNLHTGAWLDWRDTSIAGGPFEMLTKLKGFSFKEAVEYGASWAGITPERRDLKPLKRLPQKEPHQESEKEKLQKEAEESKVKIERAKALWEKGQSIEGTIAERYLQDHRKIEGPVSKDFRYLSHFKDPSSGKSYPALMVVARSLTGDITAVQITCLDPQTAAKADLSVAKRSFGILKGSAVTIQEEKSSDVLFIAEGVETALSIKEAGVKGNIKASLGLSNIKQLIPEISKETLITHIIICADHDKPASPAVHGLEKSILALKEKGFVVTVVKPDKLNKDFNDVLKTKGSEGVREILKRELPHQLTKDLFVSPSATTPIKESPKEKLDKPKAKHTEWTFREIEKKCTQYLYNYLEKEKRSLTPELKERIVLQAKKAADFIFHAHTLKGTNTTEEQTKLFLLRAKYELDRISEIRKVIVQDWQREGNFNERKDLLIAHMITERQASIEGRLYLEAKQKGQSPPFDIANLAEKELEKHRAQTKELAKKISDKYSLSEKAATFCAKNVLRYKETHGEKPSADQLSNMVKIAQELGEKEYNHLSLSKKYESHEVEYFRRKEGDALFRNAPFEEKLPQIHEFQHTQSKTSLETPTPKITQEPERFRQIELSL
ncbi:MAG: MobA/MobL family protein [Alphaproteobacteria bacterium]|nr:MobA/MobL family protein [Alphaproteobacteria bacterium]